MALSAINYAALNTLPVQFTNWTGNY